MQVYQGVTVTKENEQGVPVGAVGVVVGAADPVAVKFSDPAGVEPDHVIEIAASDLRVL